MKNSEAEYQACGLFNNEAGKIPSLSTGDKYRFGFQAVSILTPC